MVAGRGGEGLAHDLMQQDTGRRERALVVTGEGARAHSKFQKDRS